MVGVKEHLTTVLAELQWENLNVAQWKYFSSIETLLKPFVHQTNVTSSESTSIALAVPLLNSSKKGMHIINN